MKIIIDISVKEILALFGIQGEIDKKEATRLRKNANNQRYRERNRELVNMILQNLEEIKFLMMNMKLIEYYIIFVRLKILLS